MSKITVSLLTPPSAIEAVIRHAALAALTCTGNESLLEQSSNPDAERLMLGGRRPMSRKIYDRMDLLERITRSGHGSILEHINLTFRVEGISRALLQELARHRHISLSVQSTRRTLMKKGIDIGCIEDFAKDLLAKEPEARSDEGNDLHEELVKSLREYLSLLQLLLSVEGASADNLKYLLPELISTDLVMTCNLRELRHIFYLRENPPALWEFNDLCAAIKKTLPPDIVRLLEVKEKEHADD